MRSSGRGSGCLRTAISRVTLWLVVGLLATFIAPAAARGANLGGELEKLFELGAKSTPTALSAARAQYEQLKKLAAGDARIDYAYGVVLVHQHRYHDALPFLNRYLEVGDADLGAHQVRLWTQVQDRDYSAALKEAAVLGSQLTGGPQAEHSKSEDARHEAARFLGTIFEYLKVARPTAVDPKFEADHKAALLAKLGDEYTPAFAEGVMSVTRRLAKLQQDEQARTQERTLKDKQTKDEAQTAAAAEEEKIQSLEQKQRSAAKELAEIQPRLAALQDKYNQLTLQVSTARQEIRVLEKARGQVQAGLLKANLQPLEKQQHDVERQLRSLQQRATALSGTRAQSDRALGKRDKAAKVEERRAKDAAERLRQSEARKSAPNAPPLGGTATMLSTYAPFPYAAERERVLTWFSK